jgi:hypothetical protein
VTTYTGHVGANADLIAAAAALYLKPGAIVADVTYERGAFWTKTDLTRFILKKSDIEPQSDGVTRLDLRALPYRANSHDVVVLDPPYVHNPGQHVTDGRYNNAATTAGLYNADILTLYEAGMQEAYRVLKAHGGQLWLKCKDEVESGVQRWSHIALYERAKKMGFAVRDLFVIIPDSRTTSKRWQRQWHARKNHSFLWIFERPRQEYGKLLQRKPPVSTNGYARTRPYLSQAQKRELIRQHLQEMPDLSDRQIAKLLGVSHPTVGVIRRLLASPEVVKFTT